MNEVPIPLWIVVDETKVKSFGPKAVLGTGGEVVCATSEDMTQFVVIFTSDNLADAFVEAMARAGWASVRLETFNQVMAFLKVMIQQGVELAGIDLGPDSVDTIAISDMIHVLEQSRP